MSSTTTEQILELMINYAYSRKQEIEKQKVLLRSESNDDNIAQQIANGKLIEIDHWIKFMIDVKHGKVDLSKTTT